MPQFTGSGTAFKAAIANVGQTGGMGESADPVASRRAAVAWVQHRQVVPSQVVLSQEVPARPQRLSWISIPICCLGAVILAGVAVFGIRDTWVTSRGIDGSWDGGFIVAIPALLPWIFVGVSLMRSRHLKRDRSAVLSHAGLTAIGIGLPVALLLAIGAAY